MHLMTHFELMPGHSYFLGSEAGAAQTLNIALRPLLVEYISQGMVGGFDQELLAYIQWLESLQSP